MDKQKQIDEMTELMANWAMQNNMLWHEGHAKALAETFAENDYGKIHEGAVVLSKEEYEKLKSKEAFANEYNGQSSRSVSYDQGKMLGYRKGCKETAEKFAERLKALVADRNCNEDYEWEDVQVDGQIFIECVDEICKEITEGKDDESGIGKT